MTRGGILFFVALAAAAAGATSVPEAVEKLGLVRDRLGDGQIWRLWTGHLVHVSLEHLLVDLAGAMIGVLGHVRASAGRLAAAVAGLAPSLGLALVVFHPWVTSYVGLSGVVHGLWGAALAERVVVGRGAAVAGVLLALLVAKVTWQGVTGEFPGQLDVRVIHPSHAWGLGLGAAWGGGQGWRSRRAP